MTELATMLLDRDARHWWSSQEPQRKIGVRAISWEHFSDIFKAHFMGEHRLSVLHYRFETLTQDFWTARQYRELFLGLGLHKKVRARGSYRARIGLELIWLELK
jgi:Retrotransposon gag protein